MEVMIEKKYVPRPIKTQEQHEEAVAVIDDLIDSQDGTPEKELLELVSILVHDYEQREFPIEDVDPIDVIKYQMEELGVTTIEMATLVGGKARLSELLNRKRPLSINQIKAISTRLRVPADLLLAAA